MSESTLLVPLAAIVVIGTCSAPLAAEESVFFTVPTVLEAVEIRPGVVVPGDPLFEAGLWGIAAEGEVAVVANVNGSGSLGLAKAPDGSLYTGTVIGSAPFVVALDRIGTDGETTRVGTLLDTTGTNLSIFGRMIDLAWGPDGAIYATTPRLLDAQVPGVIVAPAGVQRIDPATGESELVVEVEASATGGIGFDAEGTLWFGAVTSEFPVQVSLYSLDQAGTLVNRGVVFDTAGGFIALNGFTFDLAPAFDGGVYFTTTTVFDGTLEPLMPAAVRRFDVQAGTTDTIVEPGAAVVAGLALAEDGRVYFGSGTSLSPLIYSVASTSQDGSTNTIGTAFDTTGGLYALTDQALDLAVVPHAVVQFLATVCPADLDASGAVDGVDLGVVIAAWGPCADGCPADLDDSGAVDAADLGLLLGAWGPCLQ